MWNTRACAGRGGSVLTVGVALATVVLVSGCVGEILDASGRPPSASGGNGTGATGYFPESPGVGGAGIVGVGSSGGPASGLGGSAGDVGAGPQTACDTTAADTGEGTLRRLSRLEYQLSLQDLFQLDAPPSIEGIPADTNKDGFKTFAALQTVSAQHIRAYLDVATGLADDLLADTSRRDQVIGCDLEAAECLTSFVTRFGMLAFRRPLEATEVQTITSAAMRDALDTSDRFRYAVEALLASPNFLYRVEAGDVTDGVSTLNPYELASRLSFSMWGRAPSAELLDEAASGALDTAAGLHEVAVRMSSDDRTRAFFGSFFEQWLGYEELRAPKELPEDWQDAWLDEMARETDAVIDRIAWEGENFLDLLTTNTTVLGPDLAEFYGLPEPGPDGLVTFPANHPRANTGLLTHASLLSAKSDGDRIAIRGNWLRRTFLCQNLEVPPEVAEEFGELLVGLTRVEIVKKRNTEDGCKGCHATIDPVGIAFETFDATGRFDDSVDIAPFGVTPALPGAPDPTVDSVADLAGTLRAMPEVAACLTARAFLYTHGREPQRADACTVETTSAAFAEAGYDFRALLQALVESPSFRLRRAAPAQPLTP